MINCRLGSYVSGCAPVTGSSDGGNELSGYINCREFLNLSNNC